MIVQDMPPLWLTAIRGAIAAAAVVPLLWATGNWIIPRPGDLPVVLVTALLHMAAFSALVAAGLQYVPAGRAIVLGYTTPIWVAVGAQVFLSEAITLRRAVGIIIGLAGLAVLFASRVFDWSDNSALLGSGFLLTAAFCWAANIVYVRAHNWISTPFQLVFWQLLLSAGVLSVLAISIEGAPRIVWSWRLAGLILYSAIICTALAYWAMSMVNRSLPAVTTSLGLLATPVVGIVSASILLREPLETSVFLAVALIIGGIALGTGNSPQQSRSKR
jgi:drug/metabolite transporter (DMT)-like permease